MSELALYLKWRPQRFEEVVGQERVTRALRNSLKAGRFRHAYLFSGPRGTGKTTTARLLAKAINCDGEAVPCGNCHSCQAIQEGRYLDLIEIDAATHTGVDDVRELRDKVVFAPGEGRYKVYIIDEAHRFTGNAFDALLKTLEEPPAHAVFVLATTEIERVPATIQSRCLHFAFRRVSLVEITERLAKIVAAEGFRCEEAALALIAREGNGSVRDSISLLDQLLADRDEALTLEYVRGIIGAGNRQAVRAILTALREKDAAAGLRGLQEALDEGAEARQLGQQIVEELRDILLQQAGARMDPGAEAADVAEKRVVWPRRLLLKALATFSAATNQMRRGWQPQLDLELAFLKCLEEAAESRPAEGRQGDRRQLDGRQAGGRLDVGRQSERAHMEQSRPATPARSPAPAAQPSPRPATRAAPGGYSAAEPARAPGADGELTVDKIRGRWPEIMGNVGRNLQKLLMQVDQLALEGDELIFYTTSFYREKLQDAEKRAALNHALREVFGRPLRAEFRDVNDAREAARANGETNPLEEILGVARELGAEVKEPTSRGTE